MIEQTIKTEETTSTPAATGSRAAAWILGIALVGLVWALCVNPTPESDLFWQLRTGDWILRHHQAPHVDMYSWTRYGTPWVAHEWLSFVILSAAYRLAGFGGLYLLTAIIVSTTFALLYAFLLRQTQSPLISFVLSAGAALLSTPFFQPRPQLATYLFSLITLAVLLSTSLATPLLQNGESQSTRSTRRLAWLVPMFLLWANLHAGVLIGVGLLLVFVIGDAAIALVDRGHPYSAALPITTALCIAATLATPYSYHEYQNLFSTVSNSTAMNLVAEWASPDFHQGYGKSVELFLLVLGYGIFRTRLRRNPVEMLLLAALIHEALAANRNVPLLAILGSTIAARHIQSALTWHLSKADEAHSGLLIGRQPPSTVAALVAFAALFFGFAQASNMVRSFGPPSGSVLDRIGNTVVVSDIYPERACAFIEREQFPSTMHLYNIYGDGGYLIWRMPEHPVFIDGRADVYFGSLLTQYYKMNSLAYDWRSILDSHGVDFIMAAASERQAQQFLAAPDWALVYADDPDLARERYDYGHRTNTLIFIKRTTAYLALIDRCRRDCPAYAGAASRYADWASVH